MTAQARRPIPVFGTTAFRLAAASAAAFIVAASAVIGVIFWQTSEILTEHVVAQLRAEADDFMRDFKAGGLEGLRDAVQARSDAGPGLYYLSDARAVRIAGNLHQIPRELAEEPRGGVFAYQPHGSSATRFGVALPVDVGDGANLIVGRDIEDLRRYAERVRTIFLLGLGLLSLVAVLSALAISRAVLSRIETITETSRSIMAGDLTRRVPLEGGGDELDALAASLNAMLERIEQLLVGLREVSDNIAHDLKTPLNRLRNRAEAALRDPRGADACRDGLERTIEDADELIKTFNALLLIARLEAGAVEESATVFDLAEVARDVAEFYEPVVEEEGRTLDLQVSDGAFVRANRQLVSQAIANLTDNALKYGRTGTTPAQTGIELAVSVRDGKFAEVAVADRGPGIAREDRERALRRFVRLEESRTRPGTGLGLSLVAAVARLSGGNIRLEDNLPGLRAVLSLPRVEPAPGPT